MHKLAPLPLLALLLLPACRDSEASPPQPPRQQLAIQATSEALNARLRPAEQRGVQSFAQAIEGHVAVCGRMRQDQALVPFVSIVSFEHAEPRMLQLAAGVNGAEASRVYVMLVERCFEGGGPANPRIAARAMPPLPAAQPAVAAPPPAAEAEPVRPAAETVQIIARSGANVRAQPRGGEVVRTVPASSRHEVISRQADWVQIGSGGTAWGWVHASLIETGVVVADGGTR